MMGTTEEELLLQRVDWSEIDFKYDCLCHCGVEFRSKTKTFYDIAKKVSEEPCPGCGSHTNLWRCSSGREEFSVDDSEAGDLKEA